MTVNEIRSAIIIGNFTNEELSDISQAITFARAQIARVNKATFTLGDSVKFKNSRTNTVMTGTIKKINRKFIIVNVGGLSNWRVPAAMLSAA